MSTRENPEGQSGEGGTGNPQRNIILPTEVSAELMPASLYDPGTGVVTEFYMVEEDQTMNPNDGTDPMQIDNEVGVNVPTALALPQTGNQIAFSQFLTSFVGPRGNHGRNNGPAGGGRNNGGSGNSGGSGNAGGGDGNNDDPLGNVTLADIGGLETQLTWLRTSVLSHIHNQSNIKEFGVKPPKGILFYGPPGTGKTLLARAFGNELKRITGRNVSFFHRRGPDCYSPWFGESSRILRDIFTAAQRAKPSIIFFDELDGLCPSRAGISAQGATSVVTTFLGCMDNLRAGEVFVFGATNLIESIDPAMLRPGRFDKHLEFFPPSLEARKRIIQIHTKKWKRSHPTDAALAKMAERSHGFTGADLELLANQAVVAALDRTVFSVDTIDDSLVDVEYMEVRNEDWEHAFKVVKPSPPALYNSSLFVPTLPDPRLSPLIAETQKKILKALVPRLPKDPKLNHGHGVGGHDPRVNLLNTFLIVEPKKSLCDTVGTFILPGVLTDKQVSEFPVYLLSAQRLHTSPLGYLGYLTKTMKTVMNCKERSILYIPMIDRLIHEIPQLFFSLVHNLNRLKDKPVLVLATSFTPVELLPTQMNFQKLFQAKNAAFMYATPTRRETMEFLVPVFEAALHRVRNEDTLVRKVEDMWGMATTKLQAATIKEQLNFRDKIDDIVRRQSTTDNESMLELIEITIVRFDERGSD